MKNIAGNPFRALKFKNFRLYWFGLFISRIGTEMRIIAIIWQIYTLTDSALSLAIIGAVRFIPLLILTPLTGIAADIFDRRKLVILSDLMTAILCGFLLVGTYFSFITALQIYIILGLISVAGSFNSPARQSLIPLLVPKDYLINAFSLQTLMWQSATLIGPAIGGFVIAYFGVLTVYLIDFISYFPLIFAMLYITHEKQSITQATSLSLHSFLEGVRFIKNTPILLSAMILDFFATFFSTSTVLMPIFATEVLKVGPQGVGLLYAAPSLGAVIMGFVMASIHKLNNQGKILLGAVAIYGLATILFGISTLFHLSLVLLAISGGADMVSSIIRTTIRQLVTPDHMRGRVSSVNTTFVFGGPQLGEVEAGVTAHWLGAPLSVVIGGLGTLITTALIATFVPQIKKYQGHEHEKTTSA